MHCLRGLTIDTLLDQLIRGWSPQQESGRIINSESPEVDKKGRGLTPVLEEEEEDEIEEWKMPPRKKLETKGKSRARETTPTITMSIERGKKVVTISTPRNRSVQRHSASPSPTGSQHRSGLQTPLSSGSFLQPKPKRSAKELLGKMSNQDQLTFFDDVFRLRKMLGEEKIDHKGILTWLKDLAYLEVYPEVEVLQDLKRQDQKVKRKSLFRITFTKWDYRRWQGY